MKFQQRLKAANNLIDLTPLVDVIFLMLIFFIVASNILPLKSLLVEPPRLENVSAPILSQLPIIVDRQQVIYLGSDKKILDLSSLKEALMGEIKRVQYEHEGYLPTIVLNMDQSIDYAFFLKIFSIAQQTGCPIRLVYETH